MLHVGSQPRTQPRLRSARKHAKPWTDRRVTAALSCLIFLLQALVPSFAWALNARHGGATGQADLLLSGMICSAHTAEMPATAQGTHSGDPLVPEPSPATVHCPLCLLPTGSDSAPLAPFFPPLATPDARGHPVAGTGVETLPTPYRRSPTARAPPTV